jgi:hypothetical protein
VSAIILPPNARIVFSLLILQLSRAPMNYADLTSHPRAALRTFEVHPLWAQEHVIAASHVDQLLQVQLCPPNALGAVQTSLVIVRGKLPRGGDSNWH